MPHSSSKLPANSKHENHSQNCNCKTPHPLFGLGVAIALLAVGYFVYKLFVGG